MRLQYRAADCAYCHSYPVLTRDENCVTVTGNGPRALPAVGIRAVSLIGNGLRALPAVGIRAVSLIGNGPRALPAVGIRAVSL